MSTVVIGRPSPKQDLFMRAKQKVVIFGGARGGGKSYAVRAKAKILACAYPGIKIMIIRRTYPELFNNHINTLQTELADVAKYNDQKKVLRFHNGSTILFGYLDNDSALLRYQGLEVDCLFLDEGTMLSEFQIKSMMACIRGVNRFPKHCYITANPGGQGHGYVRRLIERRFEDGEDPADYTFIQSLVTDNEALLSSQPDYIKQLEALPPKLREAWLYGRWDIFEGQFFEEFRDDPAHYKDRLGTHVIDPFEIPASWPVYRSFDWGYAKPFSCGWWTVDPDGVVYRILELYGCTATPNEGLKWTPDKVFREIHRIECEHRWLAGKTVRGVADPAIWDAETGESIAETAAKYRVYFDKGDHKRLPGWLQMHYYMAIVDERPMIYIFRNCKAFIRTIPLLEYDEHKAEDMDTTGEDHVADEVRYFLMSRPIKPRLPEEPDPYKDDPRRIFLDIPKEDILPYHAKPKMEVLTDA